MAQLCAACSMRITVEQCIKYKFMTWVLLLFSLQMSSHIGEGGGGSRGRGEGGGRLTLLFV